MTERKITAHCIKPFKQTIQLFPDKADSFTTQGYQEHDLCRATKLTEADHTYFIVPIKWHRFILSEEKFAEHFSIGYEEGALNVCNKEGAFCKHLRTCGYTPDGSLNRNDYRCHKGQDVGRGVCGFHETESI